MKHARNAKAAELVADAVATVVAAVRAVTLADPEVVEDGAVMAAVVVGGAVEVVTAADAIAATVNFHP
jgi:hypothetical protein